MIVLAAHIPGSFIAKSEVATWPLIGRLCRSFNTIFLDRARKRDLPRVIDEMTRVLRRNDVVVLFPEGTSTAGATVLPFKSSLFEAAVKTGAPVTYACLSYRTPNGAPPAHLAVCWWGEMTFAGHCYELLRLPRCEVTLAFGDECVRGAHRKALAAQAWQAVNARFTPTFRSESDSRSPSASQASAPTSPSLERAA